MLSNVKIVSVSFPDMGNETVSYLNKLLAIMTENKNEYDNFKVSSIHHRYIHTYIHSFIHSCGH